LNDINSIPKVKFDTDTLNCGASYRRIEEIDDPGSLPGLDGEEIRKFKRVSLVQRSTLSPVRSWYDAPSVRSGYDVPTLTSGYNAPSARVSTASSDISNSAAAQAFSEYLDYYNELQHKKMVEHMEKQKEQPYWNPLEPISKRDATS
jgi:hypothetical protein